VHGQNLLPGFGLASQKFTSEGFLLENLQSNLTSTPTRTRNPDSLSEEVLASVQFYANKHFNDYLISLIICFLRTLPNQVLPEFNKFSTLRKKLRSSVPF
jgi:hypothetical protein